MKHQTISQDLSAKNYGFQKTRDLLLRATNITEDGKHPVKRIKFKVTFYWE